MNIVIGSSAPLMGHGQKLPQVGSSPIDAQLLHVRPPRKGIAGPSGMERRNKKASDPRTGRVLTIMIPDGRVLPVDIDSANYDVQIRLIRR